MKHIFLILCLFFIAPKTLSGKIAVVTLAVGDDYKKIVQPAIDNKRTYCEKHGYDFICKEESFDLNRPVPWSKIPLILKVMEDSSYDWVFWTDADSLIMNLNIPLEEFIDKNYDLIISRDMNAIDTGQFMIKNCEKSRELLIKMYSHAECIHHVWWENQAFILEYEKDPELRVVTKVVPQRLFNSYAKETHTPNLKATYQAGDFIVHFAGTRNLETLKCLFADYGTKVMQDASQMSLDHHLGIFGFILAPSSSNNEGYMTNSQKAQYNEQFKLYPEVKSVAEIGLNGGHWMANILQQYPGIKNAVSFDINHHPYTQCAVEYFKRLYKNCFTFIAGNSLDTVPEYAAKFPEQKFDLLYVDGNHTFEYCLKDIMNFRKLAHARTILWVDDYNSESIANAVNWCVSQGIIEIKGVHHSNDSYGPRCWIEARYL